MERINNWNVLGKRRRQRSYKFTEKTHSKRGIVSCVLAFALLVLYCVFIYLAFCGRGMLSTYYGSAGVMAMLLALVAMLLAITSLREEDSFRLFPRLGLFLSVVSAVCWIGTYVAGYQHMM